MRFVFLLFILFITPHCAFANVEDNKVAANLIATLIDLPLLWTIYISLRTRNTLVAVIGTLFGTFLIRLAASLFSPTGLSSETLLTALWSQATLGLFIHRAISFCKRRPLFDRVSVRNLGSLELVQWIWTDRADNLINRWARRLDRVTLPLLAFLPLSYFSSEFINGFFILYALVWGLYLFGFVGLVLAIEGWARIIYSAFKNGIHRRIALTAADKLCELNHELSERKVFRRLVDWFISGFDNQPPLDSQPPKAPEQRQSKKGMSWAARLFFVLVGICVSFIMVALIFNLTRDDNYGLSEEYVKRIEQHKADAQAQAVSLLKAENKTQASAENSLQKTPRAKETPLGLAFFYNNDGDMFSSKKLLAKCAPETVHVKTAKGQVHPAKVIATSEKYDLVALSTGIKTDYFGSISVDEKGFATVLKPEDTIDLSSASYQTDEAGEIKKKIVTGTVTGVTPEEAVATHVEIDGYQLSTGGTVLSDDALVIGMIPADETREQVESSKGANRKIKSMMNARALVSFANQYGLKINAWAEHDRKKAEDVLIHADRITGLVSCSLRPEQ